MSAGFGELQYTGVKTVAASTKVCSRLCRCIRAGCGRTCSQWPRDAAGPGDAHLGRVTDKASCLYTSFRSDGTRVVCMQPQLFTLGRV